MEKWIGKVAVVTGVSGGIGKSVAKSLASAGIKVIGLDINIGLDGEFEKYPDVVLHKCDITNIESVKETFNWIEAKFSSVNILVNCAGICKIQELLGDDDDVMKQVNLTMNVNFTGLLSCTREAFRLMKKSEDFGMIINICSYAAHTSHFFNVSLNVYRPSKAAVKSLSEVLRQELVTLDNKKIRISNLSPGSVATPMSTPKEGEVYEAALEPEDIAQAVTFLLSTPYTVNISELIVKPIGERC